MVPEWRLAADLRWPKRSSTEYLGLVAVLHFARNTSNNENTADTTTAAHYILGLDGHHRFNLCSSFVSSCATWLHNLNSYLLIFAFYSPG
jgi:hypothetical protein